MDSFLSEKVHQLLLDGIKDHAIFMVDVDGYIISWNEGAKRMKGYEEHEVIGKHIRMLFSPEDQQGGRPEYELKSALTSGRFEEEWWRMKKDGSLFWANIILQPVFDDEKQHIGFAKITADITEKKLVNELNTFLMNEVSGYAIFLLDKAGRVKGWSKAAESIMGFSEEEVIGQSLGFLSASKNSEYPDLGGEGHSFETTGNRFEEEAWKAKKDGSHFWANCVINPLHNRNGYVVMIRDLTEKRLYDQESKTSLALSASNKQLNRFAYIISHELKEPIRKIATFSHMLKESNPDNHILIDKILLSSNRATTLLDNIIELSFLTQPQPFIQADLNIILQKTLKSLKEKINSTGAEIKLKPLPTASVIPEQMGQLFHHLLENAIKFGNKEGRKPVITVGGDIVPKERLTSEELDDLKHANHYLQIKIQDNGIGIDPKYYHRIFDLFSRLHATSDYEGTGLGLTICKRVAENHGGNITAYSETGKGSLFTVNLPLMVEDDS